MGELLTSAEVARELRRDVRTVNRYSREEGLIFRKHPETRRMVCDRADLDEWRSRPEIQAMMAAGDLLHGKTPNRRNKTRRQAVAEIAVAALTSVVFATA